MLSKVHAAAKAPLVPLACLALVAAPVPAAAQGPDAARIEAQRLSDHIRILASDAFEGRAPGTPGETKTIDYLVSQYRSIGLQPGGPNGSWTQDVPMRRFELDGPATSSFTINGKARPLTFLQDVVLNSKTPVPSVRVANAPVVFIGFGINAPELKWDDFKGYDVKGKIVVAFINDPDFEMAPSNPLYGRFEGRGATYYGRWTYKFQEAARRGALGILVIHEDKPATYGWNTTKNSNAAAQYDIFRDAKHPDSPLLRGFMTREVAAELLRSAGLDIDALKADAQREDFHPIALKGVTFSAAFRQKTTTIVSHNVIAKLPGTTHADEAVLYSAHWDHLGIAAPDARGDRIYNGALDNASGCASLLEIARLFVAAPRTARSVYFINFTAEEKGILGSEYYASDPVTPLGKTVALLNIDGANLKGAARDISSRGFSPLDPLLAEEAGKAGLRFSPDHAVEEGYFYRADQFNLAKVGVPGIGYASGLDLVAGGEEAGKKWVRDFIAASYHQPSDEWHPDINLDGAVIDGTIFYHLGRRLADSTLWPEWATGSPFKSIRDATRAAQR